MGTIRTTVGALRRATRAMLAESFQDYSSMKAHSHGSVMISYDDPVTGQECPTEVFYRILGTYSPADDESPEEYPEISVIGAFCNGTSVKLDRAARLSAEDKAYEVEGDRLLNSMY